MPFGTGPGVYLLFATLSLHVPTKGSADCALATNTTANAAAERSIVRRASLAIIVPSSFKPFHSPWLPHLVRLRPKQIANQRARIIWVRGARRYGKHRVDPQAV